MPLPMARPAEAKTIATNETGPTKQEIAGPNKDVALATPAPEKDSIFQKLFGTPWKGPTLAFAAPDGGIFSDGSSMTPGKYDRYTAVYDISAKTVYLPDGRKLEAHSGLGARLESLSRRTFRSSEKPRFSTSGTGTGVAPEYRIIER